MSIFLDEKFRCWSKGLENVNVFANVIRYRELEFLWLIFFSRFPGTRNSSWFILCFLLSLPESGWFFFFHVCVSHSDSLFRGLSPLVSPVLCRGINSGVTTLGAAQVALLLYQNSFPHWLALLLHAKGKDRLNSGFRIAIKSNKVRVTNSRLPQSIFKTLQPFLVLFVSLQLDFAWVLALPLTSPVNLGQVVLPLRSLISSVKWDNDTYRRVFSRSKRGKAQKTQRLSHRGQPLKDVRLIIIIQDCAEWCPVFCWNMLGLSSLDVPFGTSPTFFPSLSANRTRGKRCMLC